MFPRLFTIFSRLFTISLYNIIIFFQAVYNIRGSGNEVNSVLMRTAMISRVHRTQQTEFQINLPINQKKTPKHHFVPRNTITIKITTFQLQILNYKHKYFFFRCTTSLHQDRSTLSSSLTLLLRWRQRPRFVICHGIFEDMTYMVPQQQCEKIHHLI